MSRKIILSKDKVVLQNDEGAEDVVRSLKPFLGEVVEIKDDFILDDLLSLISEDCKFYEMVFNRHLGGFELQPFLDEAAQEPADSNDKMEYLELYWDIYYGDGDDNEIWIGVSFHGWGKYDDKMSKQCGIHEGDTYEGGFAIEFTPICDLKHYPLRLNKDFVVKHWGKDEAIVDAVREYTLYDIIGGILAEISFCGSPKDRACKLAELDQTLAEAEDSMGLRDSDEVL